jgi:hypothetical protein
MPTPAQLDPRELFRGLLRAPRLAGRLLPVLTKMGAAFALYAGHPTDPRHLERWTAMVRRLYRDP